ncbi:MAG TPA: cysteine hydrolase family protein [Candidatus Tripitaka californicus]|uniref:cysteine hydrolase family protein n=1 Tax=Candidatus Tripitaka californicus TaxID=3367616 RepID=UPI004025F016|nr:cysteine hydrolase [Planctomycetota bacterium]
MAKKALLIMDMLNDFIKRGAPLEVPKARGIIRNIRREREKARKAGIPVIYCCDRHEPRDREFEVWPPHAVRGTQGAEIIEELRPIKGEPVVAKKTYSAFYRTSLEKTLKGLGVKHLILTGVVTNICILYTAVDAYMRGYEITVPEDCVAGLKAGDSLFALRQIKGVLRPCKSLR